MRSKELSEAVRKKIVAAYESAEGFKRKNLKPAVPVS